MLPALDAPGAASRAIPRLVGHPPLARSPLRRAFVALLAAGLVVAASVIAVAGGRMVLARFVDARAVTGNTFATGNWAPPWYLHNNPTPPAGNTASQFDLPLDVTAPTATTLYNYDTNCNPAKVGRDLELTSAGVGTTTVCRYATWLAAPVATARTLSGTATLSIWSAIRNFQSGQTGNLTAYLRDYNPAAGTYTLIGTATLTQANWQGGVGTWVQKTLTWSGLSYTLAAGRRLELKVVATTAASRNMWIAYDTTAYPSALTLP
jgi:hypothetical protein